MNNNDILKRCRYAFDFKDNKMIEIFSLVDFDLGREELLRLLAKDDDYDYEECDSQTLTAFFNGLIILKRGKKEEKPGEEKTVPKETRITRINNNEILKKLRIALNYKEENMLAIFDLAEFPFSKSEFRALFRRPDHRNFRLCGDQLLRAFLKGLTIELRGPGTFLED